MFHTKMRLTLLLILVFLVNFAETAAEGRIGPGNSLTPRAYNFAQGMRTLESKLSIEKFENHDATKAWAVYGYSFSYFFLLPLLGLGVALGLMLREEIEAYRVLCLAVAIDYLVSLPFFVWMPVPERWYVPETGAMMLSDLVNPKLIEWIRPISALDNCFPSTHTSLTVILILVCYIFQVRLKTTVLGLGLTVIISTFVLGIHWIPDVAAGVAVACLSVLAARVLNTSPRLRLA